MASFELYRDAKDPKENEPPYDLLSTTAIPTNSEQVLFLVIPFKKRSWHYYQVVAMDDSLMPSQGNLSFCQLYPANTAGEICR